jgi:hypothetical protein
LPIAPVLVAYPSSTGAQRFLLALNGHDGYATWAAGPDPFSRDALATDISFSSGLEAGPETVKYPALRPLFLALRYVKMSQDGPIAPVLLPLKAPSQPTAKAEEEGFEPPQAL